MIVLTFTRQHPVASVIVATIVWMVLLIVFMGVAVMALRRPYGDPMTVSIGRLAVTACVLLLAWRLDWLKAAGIARWGRWQVWLLGLAGLVYISIASLHAFYGRVTFDFLSLLRLPNARAAVTTHFIAALSEELLFRGLVLYTLICVWGDAPQGILGSVFLSSVLFALVHLTQVFTYGLPLSAALYLVLQTLIVSLWWGALVVIGGSIWPAVMLHFVINAVVAVQGLTTPMVESEILAYRQLLWFSLPLGVLAVGLLVRTALHPVDIQIQGLMDNIQNGGEP